MLAIAQELMTPDEAAKWFRRSLSWLRQQRDLVRAAGPSGQPLYHVQVCRAYIFGRMANLADESLRRVQLRALAVACGVPEFAPVADPAENAAVTPLPPLGTTPSGVAARTPPA